MATIDLSTLVTIDVQKITRNYTKNTMVALASQLINFANTSPDIPVDVGLLGVAGATYEPANFTLAPNGKQLVVLSFDTAQIELLQEGSHGLNTIVNLTTTAAGPVPIIKDLPPPPPPITVIPPDPTPRILTSVSLQNVGSESTSVGLLATALDQFGNTFLGAATYTWTAANAYNAILQPSNNSAVVSLSTSEAGLAALGGATITVVATYGGTSASASTQVVLGAPVIIDPIGFAPKSGRWVLTQVAPGYVTTEAVATQNFPENGQAPQSLNNYIPGYYNTTFGVNRTTAYGPQYDYVVEGDTAAAGLKPIAPVRDITYTDSEQKVISNIFVRSFDGTPAPTATAPANSTPPSLRNGPGKTIVEQTDPGTPITTFVPTTVIPPPAPGAPVQYIPPDLPFAPAGSGGGSSTDTGGSGFVPVERKTSFNDQ